MSHFFVPSNEKKKKKRMGRFMREKAEETEVF